MYYRLDGGNGALKVTQGRGERKIKSALDGNKFECGVGFQGWE